MGWGVLMGFYKYSNDYPSKEDFILDFVEGRIAVNIAIEQLPQFLDTVQNAVISRYGKKYYDRSLEVLERLYRVDVQFVAVYIKSDWDNRMGYTRLCRLDELSFFISHGKAQHGDVIWNSNRRLKADELLRLFEVEVQ